MRSIEEYLTHLEEELRKRGLTDKRLIEEAREHLIDAIRRAQERGLSREAANQEACSIFGSPDTVAAAFSEERNFMKPRLAGVLNRVAGMIRGSNPPAGHYHDGYHDVAGPSSIHFALRLKRSWRKQFTKMSAAERERFITEMRERGEDVSAFEADPRERLVAFLRDFARRRFSSGETLESLTLLEDTTDTIKRGGRYLAAFSDGTRMVWSIAVTRDGGVWLDGTTAPV